jgi:ligand-binding sensor domain-containing protein/signal transduction histidine kinase
MVSFKQEVFMPITHCESVRLNWLRKPVDRNRKRNQLAWISTAIYFLASFSVSALNPNKSLFQYNCRSWARQNGLPANGVLAICQTPDGYLWLGTPRGLARFDGSEFKLFDMAHLPQVKSTIFTSLANARGGGLWFGLERGSFGRFDGRDFSLMGKSAWGGESLLVQSVLETKDGQLWIAAETMAARLNVKSNDFQFILNSSEGPDRYNVSAMCQDSRGRVWLGTAERGLYYWESGTLKKFPDAKLDELNIRSVVEDKQGQIWVGTERGLLCYDSNFKKQTPIPFPWYETRVLLVDRQGVLWIGTSSGGLCRYFNGALSQLRKTDGLADDFVSALAEDNEGSLWVGTRNGLSQINDVKIPTFGKQEGFTADVDVGVYPSSKGGFWVATGEGFIYYDGYAHSYSNNVGLANSYLLRVFEAKNGDLYLVNGSRDVEVFSDGKVVARYPNSAWPTAMAEDAQSVVASVSGDLYRVGTNFFKPYTFASGDKPPMNWIHSMSSSRDGSIWVAGDTGICRVNGETFKLWTTKDGLPNSKVIWVCEDADGILWAGLETGLARLKDGKIRIITQEDGLFDNIINAIVADDHGQLWMDSGRGFFSVSRKDLNDFADGKVSHVKSTGYDGLDAIKSSEKYQQKPSGCKTPDGKIWFPTAQGVIMIDPTNIVANAVPPIVHIHQVLANGEELDSKKNASVPPGKGNIEFHYAGLSYIAPMKIQYRYQLRGFDKDWVDAGTRRAAFYTNLKPGDYEFEVQACIEDGVWNGAGAQFAVTLLPHYYQTVWFYLLCGVSVCAVLGTIYSWRTAHLRHKQVALQKSRDLLEMKVAERTAALAEANGSLKSEVEKRELEVQRRIKTQAELENRKLELENEIEERERMQLEIERIHKQLVDASRTAGQAEVASSVLHNVGNVLNSVNVSTNLIKDHLRGLRSSNLEKAAHMIEQNSNNLGSFFSTDAKGRQLPNYLIELSRHLRQEQDYLLGEVNGLVHNVEHINEIVAMQQNYAKVSGVLEIVDASELLENALKMNSGALQRHSVNVVREYEDVQPLTVDKHRMLQILVNVIRNAKYACDEGGQPEKIITVRIKRNGNDRVRIEIADTGIGIAPENLTRIFSHGFTTRKEGHGFGLHSAALAAKEMAGTLTVHSDGLGKGASFTLDLPIKPLRSDSLLEKAMTA